MRRLFVRGEKQLQIPPLRFAAVGMTGTGLRKLGYGGSGCGGSGCAENAAVCRVCCFWTVPG